ncbi:MAG: large subunit ribosomal protein L17 [Parcubacteria group bacterium Gr01-1014_44]|nr:MAG: large subunit ribosomal protein L17 [Parcubacteria group bacterium Gr01-1014_44]
MKHHKKGKTFGRVRKLRVALVRDLMRALIEKEKIITTEAKAKALRPKIEKVITRGKQKNISNIRFLSSELGMGLAKKVYDTLSPRYQNRAGGYTRILKIAPRKSDNSLMALIEFVK